MRVTKVRPCSRLW